MNTLIRLALVSAACAAALVFSAGVSAHGDVTPQAVDTKGLPPLGEKWEAENPYRGNAAAITVGTSGYAQNCARCHGIEAISGGIAPDLRMLDRDCMTQADAKKASCIKENDDYYATTVRKGRVRNGAVYMPLLKACCNKKPSGPSRPISRRVALISLKTGIIAIRRRHERRRPEIRSASLDTPTHQLQDAAQGDRAMHRFTIRSAITSLAFFGITFLSAAPAHADLDKIQASGKLIVAVYDDFAPFSTKAGGIDIDLAEALAKKLNLKLSLLPFPAAENVNDDLRNMVWKGHYLGFGPADVMLHVPVDRNVMARNEQVEIFAPYHRETVRLVRNLKAIPDLQGADSLIGKRVGAEKVSISAMVLLGDVNLRDKVQIFGSAIEALQKLKAGELDAVVATRAEVENVLQGDANFEVTDAPFDRLPRKGWVNGMAVKKEDTALATLLQAALNDLVDSGEMTAVFAKHGVKFIKP